MDALAAAVSFAAIAGPAVLVLRDIAAVDRPVAEEQQEFAEPAPPLVVTPVLGVGRLPAAEPVEAAVAVPDLPPVVLAEPLPAVLVPAVVPPVVVAEREPVREQVTEVIRVREPVREQHGESVLASLAHTETDERSVLRRIFALLVLLTLTLVTAALVAAGIYRVVSALG